MNEVVYDDSPLGAVRFAQAVLDSTLLEQRYDPKLTWTASKKLSRAIVDLDNEKSPTEAGL